MTPSCKLNITGLLRHESGGNYLDTRRNAAGMPDVLADDLTHQQLLRAIAALTNHREAVDGCAAGLLGPPFDQERSMVSREFTTTRTKGLSEQMSNVRTFGMPRQASLRASSWSASRCRR